MAAFGGHTNFMFHDLRMQVARSATRVFHKLSTIQEWQYSQVHFSCAIRKELDQ